jgi:diguanylate cyclase (GGDEF)-like protein/PAS domain S-box-containing protein
MAIFSKQKLMELQHRDQEKTARHTVMIVDDEEANRAVMATILRPHYNLIEAADGQAALDLIAGLEQESTLACIVSDQRMPNLTGVELFQQVQSLLPLTVRIIVTGYVDVDSIVDSINKAEIYKFIVKPFDAHDFLLTVRRGVESYELQHQLSLYHQDLAEQVRVRTRELEESQARLLEANAVLRKSSEQILALYNNASCGYYALDPAGQFTHVNDTLLAWLGRTREEMVGRMRLMELVTPASSAMLQQRLPYLAGEGWVRDIRDVELDFLSSEKKVVRLLLSAIALNDEQGPTCRFTAFDVTERNQEHERIRYLASHDALTGLPNRTLMLDRIEHDLLLASRHGRQVALLFADLDGFKRINDTLGHAIGDELLRRAAARLQECVRKSDSVGRFGGDEFVISLADVSGGPDAQAVGAKILEALALPFVVNGQTLQVGVSLGVSLYPQDAGDSATLLRLADAAMYRSKAAGRNRQTFHDAAMPVAQ